MDADVEQVLEHLEDGLSTGLAELIRIAQQDLRDLLWRLPDAQRAEVSERILVRLNRRFAHEPWWNAAIRDAVSPLPEDLAPGSNASSGGESV